MTEPIAVIGLDAKYPCDGDTPEKFYEFLVAGRSAKGPVPPGRYNADAFWHPDNHRDGIIGGKQGHFIQGNVRAFDAPFFSITPAEAASMDPQQRMLLECVYTALENSGLTMDAAQGSQTGVYVGAFIWDYRDVLIKDIDAPMMYTGSGTIASTLAGRVSWFYDFRGPAMSIDTACSSSMVALHQAVVSLKAGDSNMAIACGTNLILSPEMGLELNALGVLNPDSVSYSFDQRANGYGRSEGIGAVVLKRMSDALRDGDSSLYFFPHISSIRAVIRNTGSNHDGHSPGLTAPAMEAQAELMRKTYAQAGLDPSETRFFEAHGTGTPIGDPIEAGAISEMFTPFRSPDEPLYIGAVKSNIGHSEGASGIASVIKSILTLERGIIPANVWFEKRNAKIPDEWHLQFPTRALPWPQTKTGLRRVSINSFGVSGTNAHVVMDDAFHFLKEHGFVAPHRTIDAPQMPGAVSMTNGNHTNGNHIAISPQLFVLSSHDQDGISRLCNAYKQYLPSMKDALYNLSFTLAAKRTQFNWRTAIIANSTESLQVALDEKQQVARVAVETGLAFVFTGQGAQWARMGMELMHYPIFRQSLEAADAYLKTLGCSWSAISGLSKDSEQSRLNEAEFSQPLCTVLQIALVDLLAFWGVSAHAVAGHSSGEIAAAYSVGAISRESAWKIAYWRGIMSTKLARSVNQPMTTMAAVGLDFEKATNAIDRVNKSGFQDAGKLTIACMNSRNSHTISGDAAQIDALVQTLQNGKIFARKLAVEMAYHSRYMEPMSEEYAKCMGEIQPGCWTNGLPKPQFFSSTYGTLIDQSKLQDAAYWTKNLVSPVRFHESMTAMFRAMSKLNGEGSQTNLITDMLEIGPHAALNGPLRNIVDEVRGKGAVRYHSMLKRGAADLQSALQAAGSLFTRGIQIDLVKVNYVDGLEPSMLIGLPRYPFNHSKEYWYESRLSRNFRNRAYPRHELLGAPVNDWDGKHDAVWRNWIRLSENPWVEHHTISGAILYPAAGMLVMAIEGCRQLAERSNPGKPIKGFRFREVSFHAALQVPDDTMGIESHLYLRPVKQAALENKASPWREFQICTAQDDDEWREHCRGQVLVEYDEAKTLVDSGLEEELLQSRCNDSIEEAQQKCTTQVAAKKIHDAWTKVGLVFGPTFQTVSDPFVDHESGKAFAKVNSTIPILKKLMPHEHVQPHVIHPTTLDGALQVCLAPLISNPAQEQKNAIVLTFVDELWVSGSQHSDDGYLVCADTEPHGRKEYEMTCTAVDPSTRQPKVLVTGLIVTEVESDSYDDSLQSGVDPKHRAWNIDWKPDPELLKPEEAEKAFGATGGLQRYVDALAHRNPAMKILEVGAGTGSATRDILSTLGRRYVQYDFTDASLLSFDEAQKNVSDDRVRFQVLDLGKDPATQGFEAGIYEAVLAIAGLGPTSTAIIDTVLGNVLSLLKPGGKLILAVAEGTGATENWGTHLVSCGFTGLDAVFRDQALSVVVSSAPSKGRDTSLAPSTSLSSYYIVVDPASDLQLRVADNLSSVLSTRGKTTTCGTISQYAQFSATASQEDLCSSTCILLPELNAGLLTSVTEDVLTALKSMVNGKRLLWVNKDGSQDTDLVTGFATCIRLERPELDFVILTFQPEDSVGIIVDKILEVDTAVTDSEGPIETSYRVLDGLVNIPRLVEASAVTKHIKKQTLAAEVADAAFGADSSRSLRLQIRDIGLLDSLCFDDDPLHATPLADTDVEFQTMATAVNFKDLAVMLGKIKETPVGLEAAGIVTRVGSAVTRFKAGDRVFGFAFKGAFSTHVRALEGTIAHIPENLSFAEAAVIPIVYTTAYACLYDIGELGKRASRGRKSTVLIHAAAGGVGQAAIQLAQREEAEIFVTVGSLEKRDFLEKTYGLPRDHIFSSRDVSFKAGIMRMTKGRGVDIVINSLAGDILRATWECVAPFGRFAEIGLSDIESRARISMGSFARSARFEAIELNYMQKTDIGRMEDLFERTIDSVLGQGLKRATPITTYSIAQVQDALRHMQSGKHIGKLVVVPHDNDVVPVVRLRKPVAKFTSEATYVISGGFGGLGQEIIRWMVDQGARNLIVTSRRGAVEESAKKLVVDLQDGGVKIATPACDITDKKALQNIISSCLSQMPPVRGCIQASTILSDNAFNNMTLDEWQRTLSVKVSGTWNLWETLTSKNADCSLDFFVMFSSMASIIGNPGQTNYAAGNSYQDALARCLSSQGHNVVALNVPMMSDAGMVATKPALMEYLFSIGWSHMSTEELIAALDYYCHPLSENKDMTAEQAQVVPRLWLPKYSAAEGADQPTWQREPRFNHMVLHGTNSGGDTSAKQGSGKGSTAALLSAAKSTQEAEQIVLDALMEKLTKVLSVDMAELDPSRPMNAYGVDSLVAVELRTWMTKEIGSDVSVFEITGGQRIQQLAAKAAGTSRFVPVPAGTN
ncbi:Reducing polyketide synthase [Lachnellula willkommii]|uniref:Reducing polyketide synthase n=1 Tax=Lachnellula willkommii TaxID=215461 RepID=A0A559MEQ7_9HELO|nr:Reducing polyketide synthase [Lachnellula willkommii]